METEEAVAPDADGRRQAWPMHRERFVGKRLPTADFRWTSKMRPRENRVLRDALNSAQKFVDKRTFICEAPKLLIPSTVTQSTRK